MKYKNHNVFPTYFGIAAAIFFLCLGGFFRAQASESVLLSWDASSEPVAPNYRVHYGTTSRAYTATMDVGTSIEALVPNLSVGTTYFFAVTAFDTPDLQSEFSDEVSVTIAPPPPITFGGTYSGSVVAVADGTSAFAELNVSKSGIFSGRVIVGNLSIPVRGTFNVAGKATVRSLVPTVAPWTFTFQLNPGSGSMEVHLLRGSTDVPLTLNATPYSSVQVAPQAGYYTARFGALESAQVVASASPGAGGFATMTITASGRVRTAGRLADNTAFTSSCYLGANGQLLIHSPLYRNPRGLLGGGISIRETPGISDGDGVLRWRKPVLDATQFFKEGFDGTVPVLISRFQRIASLQTSNTSRTVPARALLAGGGLPLATPVIERDLAFLSGNLVTVLASGSERLRLQIRGGSGMISGSFIHPGDGRVRYFSGVLFQKQGAGAGYFPGLQTTGRFELSGLGGAVSQ